MPVFHMLMEPVTQKGRDFSWGSIRYSPSEEAKTRETCVPAFTIIIIIICQRDLRCKSTERIRQTCNRWGQCVLADLASRELNSRSDRAKLSQFDCWSSMEAGSLCKTWREDCWQFRVHWRALTQRCKRQRPTLFQMLTVWGFSKMKWITWKSTLTSLSFHLSVFWEFLHMISSCVRCT